MNKKIVLCIAALLIVFSVIMYLFSDSYALFTTSSEANGSITVPENNYCLNHGFDRLSDCILVMENYSNSVEDAKEYISSKGNGTFSQMAPTITYRETTTEVSNSNGVLSTTAHFTLGSGYTFNSSTGMFTLTNYTNNDLSDQYIDYYTCGATNGTSITCSTMYQVKAYTVSTSSNGTTTYRITSAVRHNYRAVDALDSEIGLYASSDNDGSTYYYRGNVKNNYVSFAGYIWRVIRVNGNGSVRMIYSGKSTSDTGSSVTIGNSAYNSKNYDPTYVGYMYSEDFALNTSSNSATSYNSFSENVRYYFGTGYVFDEASKTFRLSGDTIFGTWEEVHDQAISQYPYTCFSTSSTGSCTVMKNVTRYSNPYTATVKLISNNSISYEATLNNTTSSTIKSVLDTWYINNILNKTDSSGKSYASYLSDEVFCSDRSLNSGSGYLLSPTSTYGAYRRIYQQKVSTLQCSQDVDKFTVSDTKGNGKLTYPIGLLTIDEASMAGGLCNSVNTQYYLYTGQTYWTMSPSLFNSGSALAYVWYVSSTGYLNHWATTSTSLGVRPVVNLSADVLISGGDGTSQNPYVIMS